MAGLCCAGELVAQGARPLLIAESKEVGVALKTKMVGDNRGFMQIATVQSGWGGGWWINLVRRLNVPVKIPLGLTPIGYDLAIHGFGEGTTYLPSLPQMIPSATGFKDLITSIVPVPAECAEEFERIVDIGINIPYTELLKMTEVPLLDWLEDQKADETLQHLMVVLTNAMWGSTGPFARDNASVFGTFATLRSALCSEAVFAYVYPDYREGLAIPLARTIEERGGTVWRGGRTDHVLIENGRVTGVVMEDGTEARAPMVALACGNDRAARLFQEMPPELEGPVAQSQKIAHRDFHVFAVLDKPVIPDTRDRWIGVIEPDGTMPQWIGPLHNLVPWSTEPGKQFVVAGRAIPVSELGKYGTDDEIRAGMHAINEAIFPGYQDAICMQDIYEHKSGHLWFENHVVGPKLPNVSDSVDGLWYANESSWPQMGLWMESAASAGILGARAMRDRMRAK